MRIRICLMGLNLFALLSGCAPTKFKTTQKEEIVERSVSSEADESVEITVPVIASQKSCSYKGQTIAHLVEVDFFTSSSVAYDQVCSPVKRRCIDGQFDGNSSARFESCAPVAPKNCRFDSETVLHGSSLMLSNSERLAFGETCLYKEAKCTDGQFSIDVQTYKYKNCVVDSLQQKSLTVQSSISSTPFKLLIVVDNSYTMRHTQERLSQNVESLLRPLAGKNVNVRIVSTSTEQNLNYLEHYKFKRQDGTSYARYDQRGLYGLPEYSDRSISSIELLRTYTEHDVTSSSFSLSTLDSAEGTEQKINQIKEKILAIGVGGSDDESGLCAIYRYLYSAKVTQDSFFKTGDKAAVVLLSDENDSSFKSANNCVRSYSLEASWRTAAPNFYYQYYSKVQGIRVKFSFEVVYDPVYRDNNLVSDRRIETRTDGHGYLSSNFATDDEIQSGVCAQKAQEALRMRGDNIKNAWGTQPWSYENYSRAIVASCERVVLPKRHHIFAVHYPSSLSDVNSCQSGFVQTQFGLKSLSEAEFESFPTYDMNPLPISNVFGSVRWRYHSDCERETHGTTSETFERYTIKGSEPQVWNYHLSGLSSQNQQQAVFDSARDLFGANFYMSFVVNPIDSTCKLEAGQSNGVVYHEFAALSKNMATYPICAQTYAPSLDLVRNFIQNVTVLRYPLGLPSTARILSVSKSGMAMNSADWEFSAGELVLKGTITAGEQILVSWAPR